MEYTIVEDCITKPLNFKPEPGYKIIGETDDPKEAIKIVRSSTNENKDVLGKHGMSVIHTLVQYM